MNAHKRAWEEDLRVREAGIENYRRGPISIVMHRDYRLHVKCRSCGTQYPIKVDVYLPFERYPHYAKADVWNPRVLYCENCVEFPRNRRRMKVWSFWSHVPFATAHTFHFEEEEEQWTLYYHPPLLHNLSEPERKEARSVE